MIIKKQNVKFLFFFVHFKDTYLLFWRDIYWSRPVTRQYQPILSRNTTPGAQSGPLAAPFTEPTSQLQLELAAVSRSYADILPFLTICVEYEFNMWQILTYCILPFKTASKPLSLSLYFILF